MSANQWSVKYRPKTLKSYIGSDALKSQVRAIISSQSVHALLIHGHTGTGKTTLARIIARGINGKLFERNLSEYNMTRSPKVEDMRALLDTTQFIPALGGSRVYILDEAHGMTKQAESALLKTLEEPPHRQLMFILCTDQPYKLPESIQNRCRSLKVEVPEPEELITYLNRIVTAEDIFTKLSDNTLDKLLHNIAETSSFIPRLAVQNLQALAESGSDDPKELLRQLTNIKASNADSADKSANTILLSLFKSKTREEAANAIIKAYANAEPMGILHTMLWKMHAVLLFAVAGKFNYAVKDLVAELKKGKAPSVETMTFVLNQLATLRAVKLREIVIDPSHIILPTLLQLAFDLIEE